MKYKILAVLLVLGVFGCSDDEETIPILDESELAWPEQTFTAEMEPMVESVPPRDQWDSVSFPLEVTGSLDEGTEGILYSLSLGHYWLLRNQLDNGDYLYDYDALTGEGPTSASQLQSLATAWSQVIVYRFLQREEHLLAAYHVAKMFQSSIQTVENEDGELMAHVGDATNRTAFMFFTLVELESVMQTGEFTETIEQMARFFEFQVDETGCIYTSRSRQSECADQHSVFAVGQGLVALERLYRHTGDEKYLDLLERATGYYYEYMRTGDRNDRDPYWLAWAGPPMVTLLIERPNEDHINWIFSLADYRASDQYVDDAVPSYIGGFKKISDRPPSWSAVSYIEGIADAYRLAEAQGDEDRMKLYRQSCILAARYLMSLQYRKSNVDNWPLDDPDRAIGAYHFAAHENASSISMHYIRTDYMDHMAITLTKILTYLDLPETYPGPGLVPVPE